MRAQLKVLCQHIVFAAAVRCGNQPFRLAAAKPKCGSLLVADKNSPERRKRVCRLPAPPVLQNDWDGEVFLIDQVALQEGFDHVCLPVKSTGLIISLGLVQSR